MRAAAAVSGHPGGKAPAWRSRNAATVPGACAIRSVDQILHDILEERSALLRHRLPPVPALTHRERVRGQRGSTDAGCV